MGRITRPLIRHCPFLPRVPTPSTVAYWAIWIAIQLHTSACFSELFQRLLLLLSFFLSLPKHVLLNTFGFPNIRALLFFFLMLSSLVWLLATCLAPCLFKWHSRSHPSSPGQQLRFIGCLPWGFLSHCNNIVLELLFASILCPPYFGLCSFLNSFINKN